MIAAGLLAQKAVERGLERRPWVKSSLAPGSKVVSEYYRASGLDRTSTSSASTPSVTAARRASGTRARCPSRSAPASRRATSSSCAVLSGNRNFEARIHGEVKANYLASPPLVVAYALAGRMDVDLVNEPLGQGSDGQDVFLRDLWPSRDEIDERDRQVGRRARCSRATYADVFTGDERWRALDTPEGELYAWEDASTYVRLPPYFEGDAARAGAGGGRRGRALPRHARRLGHDRPHLAGRRDPARFAGREVPRRARRRAARVQLVRRAARQPRGDGARHVRERPAARTCSCRAARGPGPSTSPTARRGRSSTSPSATAPRACRRSSSPARSTAPARRATGRRRARTCSACAPRSRTRTSGSTARTS